MCRLPRTNIWPSACPGPLEAFPKRARGAFVAPRKLHARSRAHGRRDNHGQRAAAAASVASVASVAPELGTASVSSLLGRPVAGPPRNALGTIPRANAGVAARRMRHDADTTFNTTSRTRVSHSVRVIKMFIICRNLDNAHCLAHRTHTCSHVRVLALLLALQCQRRDQPCAQAASILCLVRLDALALFAKDVLERLVQSLGEVRVLGV